VVSFPVFLKFSATTDHYTGSRRTRGPLNYHNIPLSRKDHAVALVSANMKTIAVRVVTDELFLAMNVK
jgi:hypothetical protein